MKKKWIFEVKPPYDPHFWELTRDDLDPAEIEIYDAVLPKLNNPNPEQLRMLAVYAYAASEFKKAFEDKDLANHLRRCMIYARNGLGSWKPVHISHFELLLDAMAAHHEEWPPVDCCLDPAWQFGED